MIAPDPIAQIISDLSAVGYSIRRASDMPEATAGVISGDVQRKDCEMAEIESRGVVMSLVGGPLDGRSIEGSGNTDFYLGDLQEKPASLHCDESQVRPLYLVDDGKLMFKGYEGRFPGDVLYRALRIIDAQEGESFTYNELLLAHEIMCDSKAIDRKIDERNQKNRKLRIAIARNSAQQLIGQQVNVNAGLGGFNPGTLREVNGDTCTIEWPDGFKMVNLDVELISPLRSDSGDEASPL